ncbi:MAG: hypothetical protein J6O40_03405 [Ruminococcus sp.]|nr:hypothetical protein [Ruminococcus sp.]
MKARIITVFFLAFIFGFGIVGLIMKDREFSDMENRTLAQSPEVTGEKIMNGEFQGSLETYLSDQMPLRDGLYALKVDYERLMLKTYQNGVYFADDGYLIQEYKENTGLVENNIRFINGFVQKVDVPVTFMLVPTATAVLNDKLPAGCLNDDQMKTAKLVKDGLDEKIDFICPYEELKNAGVEQQLQVFYKTDHHWNANGAAEGYLALMRAIGKQPSEVYLSGGYDYEPINREFYGTLYSKAPSALQKADRFTAPVNHGGEYKVEFAKEQEDPGTLAGLYDLTKLETKDKYAALFGGNFSHYTIHSNGENDERILVIKDSYANAVLPYLADSFKTIDVVDMRYYHMEQQTVSELIKSEGISRVIMLYNVDFFNSDNNFLWLD